MRLINIFAKISLNNSKYSLALKSILNLIRKMAKVESTAKIHLTELNYKFGCIV